MRYTQTAKGYRHDKIIYYAAFLILILFVFYIGQEINWKFEYQPYLKCDKKLCFNPFYIGMPMNPTLQSYLTNKTAWQTQP
jgi:hypothetical protein